MMWLRLTAQSSESINIISNKKDAIPELGVASFCVLYMKFTGAIMIIIRIMEYTARPYYFCYTKNRMGTLVLIKSG